MNKMIKNNGFISKVYEILYRRLDSEKHINSNKKANQGDVNGERKI